MGGYRVISVEALGKKKYKITLEGAEAVIVLSLYPSDIRRYGMTEGVVLSDKSYEELSDILYKRGKERALYYLKNGDKTISQMRTKLKEGFYPTNIIDNVISFLEEYGYVDDYRYVQNFISYNKNNKSIQRMKNDLSLKGISRNIIDEVCLEVLQECEDNEKTQIESYCRKKIKPDMDDKQYNKITMSLMRKGFRYEQVKSVLRRMLEETTT